MTPHTPTRPAEPVRAAVGTFPYPHRTVAEVDAAEREVAALLATSAAEAARKAVGGNMGLTGPALALVRAQRSTGLPDAPCARCGARGWCDHRRLAA